MKTSELLTVFLSSMAIFISLGTLWLSFFQRKPKALVWARSSEIRIVADEGSGSEVWEVVVANVGRIPIALTELTLVRDVIFDVEGQSQGSMGERQEVATNLIPVDEIGVFEVVRPDPFQSLPEAVVSEEEIDQFINESKDRDINDGVRIEGSLLSARGSADFQIFISMLEAQTVTGFRPPVAFTSRMYRWLLQHTRWV